MTRASILDGVDVSILQARLSGLQTAYLDLTTGGKVETAAYSQGDGGKSVTYTKARIPDLVAAILAVQTQIGMRTGVEGNRRRPMRPYFG